MSYKIMNATCVKQSKKALCIEADEFEEAQWVPISQLQPGSEVKKEGDKGTLIVSDWIAKEKEWTSE